MNTRLTGRGRHDDASWCTRTVSSALAREVSATCPSIPAVLRPALRCVACRTLTSVLLQLRSISFCRFLTVARSPSCAALKIRCRSRRTFSSCRRQSTASQSRSTSSGPFTMRCLTCPSVPAVRTASLQRLTRSRQRSSWSRAPGPVSGQLSGKAAWRSRHCVPVSCRLSSAGIGFLSVLFPPEDSALLTVGLPSRLRRARTLGGFPCSARMRYDRGGCLLYSGAAVSSRPAQPL